MDDTSLQRKLIQMEKEVRSLKIAHERGLGVVQMWVKYTEAVISPKTKAYLHVRPIDSTNFFANASGGGAVIGLTIMNDGEWRFSLESSTGGFNVWIQANNQFTCEYEAVS